MNKRKFGIFGEKIAQDYLREKGYDIIKTNFYTKRGEIDIISTINKTIVFIEVKTRSSLDYGTPAMAVDNNKLNHIKYAAKVFLMLNNFKRYNVRFDVIEIIIKNGRCMINHIEQVI